MNIGSVVNFALSAFNVGVMVMAIANDSRAWVFSFVAAVYCFCLGMYCLK